MLGIERESLADQYYFYGCGDLMFSESTRAERDAFVKRVQAEFDYAEEHDGLFRDGSRLPAPLEHRIRSDETAAERRQAQGAECGDAAWLEMRLKTA